MGKCLSCCEPEDQPVRNGHPGTTTPTKTTAVTASVTSSTTYHFSVDTKPQPYYQASAGPDIPMHKLPTNGDKKIMFNPYPKLPPIRKPSGSDSKRISFTSKDFSEAKINSLFDHYKDNDEDIILADGIERFCADLEVNPDDFRILVLAWKFEAETMCRFTRAEFLNGCKKLRVDSIKGIQSKFAEILTEVKSRQTFKDLYRWTYKFGLDVDVGQRTLPVDMAMSLWKLVFSQSEPSILTRWLLFLEQHPTIRGIPKDTWDMFLNFTESVGDDLSSYDESEAWPSLFDDFVEYENDRENQNVEKIKEEWI